MVLPRAFALLRLLSSSPDGLNLSSIASRLEVPKSSLSATLSGLTEQGYLKRRGTLYFLGEEALSLAAAILSGRSLRQIARPYLQQAMGECGETVLLATMSADDLGFTYVDFVETPRSIRFCARIGEHRPLHPTACGKLFLAHMPEARRRAYYRTIKLTPYTENTLTDEAEMECHLAEIRERGFSVTLGDYSADASGFAAPIYDASGDIAGGVVIGAPLSRGRKESGILSQICCKAAAAISQALGHSDERAIVNPDGR